MSLPVETRAYLSPIDPQYYSTLAVVLSTIGFVFFVWFFVYELTTSNKASTSFRKKRSIVKEILLGIWASFFLGFGTLFLLLWTGVYV